MKPAAGLLALNLSATPGTVEPGKYADLVVVRGNPLADITATRNVLQLVRGGVLYDPGALLESVMGRLGPENAAQAEWWKGDPRLGG
ncbi:MAG TPA: hypothetical protein VLA43_05155 [Longimicrobiales bacterium]|nr:hypothetical protein [Longimicrobiales bacterium]